MFLLQFNESSSFRDTNLGHIYLVQALNDMSHFNQRRAILLHLVEDVVAEEFEKVPITCFSPLWVHVKSIFARELVDEVSKMKTNVLRAFVDEA